MAENRLRGLAPQILRQYEGAIPYLSREDIQELGYSDINRFKADLRDAILEFERSPYPPARGATPSPVPAEVRRTLFPEPEIPRMPAVREQAAEEALRGLPTVEPPPPPTQQDIFRGTMRPPARVPTPEQRQAVQALSEQESGPLRVGEPRPSQVGTTSDPFGAVSAYLTGGAGPGTLGGARGAGGFKGFTPPTRPQDLDAAAARKLLSEGMPGEREAGEVYKADPYMTMLQTGLRILAAKPELGQGAIAQIAGPVATGVEQYQAEKEKERLSKREESKEAREEAYRRFGAKRDIESKLIDISESAKNRDIQFQTLRNNVEKGASEREIRLAEVAYKGAENALHRAELALKLGIQRNTVPQAEVLRIVEQYEPERIRLESIPPEDRTPEQNARLAHIERMQLAVQRVTGALVSAQSRERIAEGRIPQQEERNRVERMRVLEKAIKDHDSSMDRGPEWQAQRNRLISEFNSLAFGEPAAPPSLPPPPRR